VAQSFWSSFFFSHFHHPSSSTPFVPEENSESIYDACQQSKSHQLLYPRSTSVSSRPLELILSDVWGLAPTWVGRNNFYVSFINDFSKFTWIYLLRHKSEVFQRFHDFQNMVERMFDHKILAIQTDWGGEYQKLNSFFSTHWHLAPCFLSLGPSIKWFS
jgi:hypothetical protein